jgi:hypothetical protein
MQPLRHVFAAAVAGGLIAGGFGFAPSVSADQGGTPTVHACHGQFVSIVARTIPLTLPQTAEVVFHIDNMRDFNASLRDLCGE